MTEEAALQGACSCGRNHYIIISPLSFRETFSVLYDDRAEHSRSLSLRVPLSQLRSTTYAFYPDETHSSIRRVFTPRHAPQTKRHFCGFCGTPLTHWSEERAGDAEWVHVNVGSLKRESIEKLSDQGLLSGSVDALNTTKAEEKALDRTETSTGREIQGLPWFEEMIEGSELGRLKRRRGGQSSADGRSKVDWEVVEFSSETGDTGANTGKRKLDQVVTSLVEMGTLTDITFKTINKDMRNGGSPMQLSSNAPSQSAGKRKGNFMSPTMASTTKGNPFSTSKVDTRASTPSSIKIEKAATGKWMTSAARRVGLRRVGGDGIPRSKKEGSKMAQNAVSFPDKLSVSPNANMPDSPLSTPTLTPSLNDKPLPSPPIAQIMTAHVEEPRSLIDASEKPLLRSSPKSPRRDEEWPVLFPQKVTLPSASRESPHRRKEEPMRSISNGRERYPSLSGSDSAGVNNDQKPTIKVPVAHKGQRKQVSTANLREKNVRTTPIDGQERETIARGPSQASTNPKTFPNQPKNSHRLSAGAAAVEKSAVEANLIKEPRQTRTSSLRARISAGQVIKESPNKVLGFTDFTADKVPSKNASKEDVGSAAAFRARASSSFSSAFTKKPSKESLRGSRAPAQFVAGSRRPTARRPSSRGSLRSESRASSPAFLEPSRPAPPVPNPTHEMHTRKSSIPIMRNATATTLGSVDGERSASNLSSSVHDTKVGGSACSGVAFEDKPGQSAQDSAGTAPTSSGSDHTAVLESIAEAPQSTFRSKRISSKSPTFGPTLTISSSAHRLIMDTKEVNKENHPLSKKRSKDLFHAAVTNEHRGINNGKTQYTGPTESTRRPLSSQGFPENRSVNDSADTPRAKKVKSADLSSISSSQKPKTEVTLPENVAENQKKAARAAADGPFSDSIKQQKSWPEHVEEPKETANSSEAYFFANPTPYISPVKDSATPISDAMPVIPAFLPETLQEHVRKSVCASNVVLVDEVETRKGRGAPSDVSRDNEQISNQRGPSTPKKGVGYGEMDASIIFPPRSSSRTKHPDYTINGSAKSSPLSPLEQAAIRLQKEISASEYTESKVAETAGVFPPLNLATSTAGPEISSQTILADPASKRGSTAQESNRSQSSISKGLMSNFRGLFHHKRASDNSDVSNLRSIKKGSVRPTVTANGSPFPSVSNIHLVHRPTQSSTNRANATVKRMSGHGVPPAGPDTPAFASPKPSELSTTTALAMQILESARKESSSPKKKLLLNMGEVMVDVITRTREAEKAFEEAKQAARKAEVAHTRCKQSVSDIAQLVREWKDDD
ncbi:MAG: hypothetical protein Q9181_002774 [Wetmoreana brouardii]